MPEPVRYDPSRLPVHVLREPLHAALRESLGMRFLVSAPTGSGKSTQLPQWIMEALPPDREVVVLQPRRLAARMLARRVAWERGTPLGGEVGYQVRLDARISGETRLRFVTEGVLLRQILDDPGLRRTGAILFDEFHERHLYGDLTLAVALQCQRERRPDLILGVMSATLDTDWLGERLAPCRRFHAEGRLHPVDIRYAAGDLADPRRPVWERAVEGLAGLFRAGTPGDALVFMPGSYEIRKTLDGMQGHPAFRGFACLPLFGDLPPEQQDAAVNPGERPRVVVATNVAETSITIEGIRYVVDSGLARTARYDPRRGLNMLPVEPISRSSADQRAGRAGRTGPGVCLRLWREQDHRHRPLAEAPEIVRLDLSEIFLLLLAGGTSDLAAFPWIEAPPPGHAARAVELLTDLGALHLDGTLSSLGRTMAGFPLHPRYARMFLEAEPRGVLPAIALCAALAQGRDILLPARDAAQDRARESAWLDATTAGSDFLYRLRAWEEARAARFDPDWCRQWGVHGVAARQAGDVARQLLDSARAAGLDTSWQGDDPLEIRKALLAGFPDHVGLRLDRGTRRCALVHGRRGELRRESVLADPGLLTAADIEEVPLRGETQILLGLATAIEIDWLSELFPEALTAREEVALEPEQKRVVLRRERVFHDLVLERTETDPPPGAAAALLAAEVKAGRLEIKAWDEGVEAWIRRVNCAARHFPEMGIAPVDAAGRDMLIESVCAGALSYREVRGREVWPVLRTWLPAGLGSWLDRTLPVSLDLPRRRKPAPLEYGEDGTVTLATMLQDLYDVPARDLYLADGRIPLRLEILAPNRRPVQVTTAERFDAFWTTSYPAIRKELKGRYPKHEWR